MKTKGFMKMRNYENSPTPDNMGYIESIPAPETCPYCGQSLETHPTEIYESEKYPLLELLRFIADLWLIDRNAFGVAMTLIINPHATSRDIATMLGCSQSGAIKATHRLQEKFPLVYGAVGKIYNNRKKNTI